MYGIYFLLTGGYIAPIISMLAIAAPPKAKGQVMGYYVVAISLAQLISPLTYSAILGNNTAHKDVAFSMMINCVIPNGLSAICFWAAGICFKREIDAQNEAKANDIATAVEKVPELARSTEVFMSAIASKQLKASVGEVLRSRYTNAQGLRSTQIDKGLRGTNVDKK